MRKLIVPNADGGGQPGTNFDLDKLYKHFEDTVTRREKQKRNQRANVNLNIRLKLEFSTSNSISIFSVNMHSQCLLDITC